MKTENTKSFLLLAAFSVLAVFGVVSSTAESLPAGVRAPEKGVPQIFVDDALIAHKEGVTRKSQPCRKLPEPVLQPQTAWEGGRVYLYGTVLRDETSGAFRMWYMSAGPLEEMARDPRLAHRKHDYVLYATSQDGVHWERPALGLYSFAGATENNIVYDYHSPSMIYAPDAAPEERYTLIGRSELNGEKGYCVAHSQDGLHWADYPENPVLTGGDTCTLTRDPWAGGYLAYHKRSEQYRGQSRRLVYVSASKDMQHWSTPALALGPDEIDDAQTQAEGGICSHFYNLSAFPYAGQFLGFVTHFRYRGAPAKQGPEQSQQDGPIDVQLVHSRDGLNWGRSEDRVAVIPNGPYGYDAGCILGVANQPVEAGDEMWLYYTAITTTHGGCLPEKRITIARAAWPRDRFMALEAEAEGVVETAGFPCPGKRLCVNADASGGALSVAVLGEDGTPLSGFDKRDCVALTSDALRHEVQWKGGNALPEGKPVRVRFYLNHARLFSYTFE